MPTPSAHESFDADATWQEIQRLVADLRSRARSGSPRDQFLPQLLSVAVQAAGALGGILWTRDRDGRLCPEFHRQAERTRLSEDPQAQALHAQALEACDTAGGTRWILSGAGATSPGVSYVNRGDSLSFTPLAIGEDIFAVLELIHAAADDPSFRRGCEDLLATFSDAAQRWRLASQLAQLAAAERWSRDCEQFAARVHAQLDLTETAAEVVNEVRRLLRVDRVSLALRDGPRLEIRAISGVESVDRRAAVVRSLEELATAVARSSSRWTISGQVDELPPEIAEPFQRYADHVHPRWLAAWPLLRTNLESSGHDAERLNQSEGNPDSLGVLIIERLTEPAERDLEARLARLHTHAVLALEHAWEYSALPGFVSSRWLRRLWGQNRSRRSRRLLATGIALTLAAFVGLLPVDFTIESPGALQPSVVQDVFAPADGEVSELRVRHDQRVTAGESLVALHSTTLDLERRRITGELETTRERLLAVEAARLLASGRDGGANAASPGGTSLSASEEELRRSLESWQEQLTIVEQQCGALDVRSPLDGTVLTWNPEELLTGRPVQRGQVLLRVGDTAGPWELRLDLPDRRVGHIETARQSTRELPVRFTLAMTPGVSYQGHVARVARVTELDDAGHPCVRVYVAIPTGQLAAPRAGATVTAKVYCGRRPLAYVWLRELWELIQTRLLF